MTARQIKAYADLILWSIDGAHGQRLLVRAEPENRELALAVVEAAYADGAVLVDLQYEDPLAKRAHIRGANDVGVLPGYDRARWEEYADPSWSMVSIKGSGYPEALADCEPGSVGAYAKAQRGSRKAMMSELSAFRKAWVGVLMPTDAIAAKALGDADVPSARERYEAAVVRVLHLDDPDPTEFWSSHFDALERRRTRFNEHGFDRVRFTGPGTDIVIGLHEGGRWQTAQKTLADGRTVRVNMPSCEIFTTPDLRRTRGRVATTRPFVSTSAPGQTIEGAWLEFADGAVVASGAATGANLLESVLAMDDQARYLGELALVDATSSVARESMVFHEVLYDENAACHIALGYGFPGLVDGTDGRSPDELVAMGVNHSLVHDDLMIGGEEVDVTGFTSGGDEVAIMRCGVFAEEFE